MRAASAAFLPALVSRKEFSRAANWNAGTFQLSCIIGRVAAGSLIAGMQYACHSTSPAAPVYIINALASVIVCVLMGLIRRQHVVQNKEPMTLQAPADLFQVRLREQNHPGADHARHVRGVFGRRDGAAPDLCRGYFVRQDRPGSGFLAAALPTWVPSPVVFILNHRPPMQKAGRAMLWAVTAFGLATIAFGFSTWFLVLDPHAVHVRRSGQRERGGAAYAGADAYAGR